MNDKLNNILFLYHGLNKYHDILYFYVMVSVCMNPLDIAVS